MTGGSESSQPTAPIQVLQVIEHMRIGGREMALYRLARSLDRHRFRTVVATFLGGELADALAAEGLEVVRIDARSKLARIGALRALIRARDVDVVHSHMFSAGTWARLAASTSGGRGIVHTHATLSFRERPWKTFVPEAVLTALTDRVICVSRAVRDHLATFLPPFRSRMVVIPNGLDVDPAAPPRRRDSFQDPPHIVAVGRLEPVKGFDVLIRALAELAKSGVPFRCTLAGDGGERGALESLARELGLADRIAFLGYRTDVAELLSASDLYVAPSHREGLSNAVLEAMAAGLPIVATRVGGNPELLDAIGGLVPPADPIAMSAEIRRTLADPAAAWARGERARAEIVSNYTLVDVVARHQALYTEVATRARPARRGAVGAAP